MIGRATLSELSISLGFYGLLKFRFCTLRNCIQRKQKLTGNCIQRKQNYTRVQKLLATLDCASTAQLRCTELHTTQAEINS